MGSHCSFGDDRHLTNRVLSLGYATKYTARSKCLTETPKGYLRWLNQQTRWSQSRVREWLYNAVWFHKHHLRMTYEAVITGFFPFLLIATVIRLFYRSKIWNMLLFLLTVQLVGLIKSSSASCLRGNIIMVFMSLYSMLYMSSLLPAKMFAVATISKAGWGTSGRKSIVNFIGLIPVSVWYTILLGGVIFTIYKESKKPFSESKQTILIVGTCLYACYWVMFLTLYVVLIKNCGRRNTGQQYDMVLDV
ncbi:hyaluronan synthase 2-like [Physeter macrocephalus]|uniref:Hyaluronan synthase 2 n=1 Tax=Physeter macrocephalus TaxID=9755 RepID=A0A9W2WQX8_PHYMC|nr:hyaluronan synthase 2-like [Physeter catodon]